MGRYAWGQLSPTLNVNSGSLNPSDLDFDSGKLARYKMIEVRNILISHTSKMTSDELRCHIKMSGLANVMLDQFSAVKTKTKT